jgi:hypothetical protein
MLCSGSTDGTAAMAEPDAAGEERRLRRQDLERAVAAGVIDAARADALWQFLEAPSPDTGLRPRFDLVHVLWYAGALIVIGAMSLFTSLAFARLGGGVLAAIAALYAVLFTVAGKHLWRRGLRIPGGLLIAVAVTMAPLFVYGVQDALGWWTHAEPGSYRGFRARVQASRLPMELATVAAGLLALRFWRFPFLVAPIAAALGFMSVDLAPWVFGVDWASWDQRKIVALGFGLVLLVVAWAVDLRTGGDFAFWLHLAGLAAFWGGLTLLDSHSELGKAAYCLINLGLLVLALPATACLRAVRRARRRRLPPSPGRSRVQRLAALPARAVADRRRRDRGGRARPSPPRGARAHARGAPAAMAAEAAAGARALKAGLRAHAALALPGRRQGRHAAERP